jgi:hypothetical protein
MKEWFGLGKIRRAAWRSALALGAAVVLLGLPRVEAAPAPGKIT